MIQKNFALERLRQGKPILGSWNTLASPLVTEVLASGGLDFLMVDFEHGPFDLTQLSSYVNACERYSCSPIVRIPRLAPWMTLQALDQGAHGVMVPHIDTVEDAKLLIKSSHYHPRGERGFSPFTKAGGFTNATTADYVKRAADFTLTAIIVESKAALDNLDDILKLPEIDVVYFGAYDLSQALGVPGQVKSDAVVMAIKQGAEKVRKSGKFPGGFVAQSDDDIRWQIDLGLQFITYNVDAAILLNPVRDIVSKFALFR